MILAIFGTSQSIAQGRDEYYRVFRIIGPIKAIKETYNILRFARKITLKL